MRHARNAAVTLDYNPHWFHYPTLYTHFQTPVVTLAAEVHRIDLAATYPKQEAPTIIYVWCRVVTVLLGVATVLAVNRVASILWGRRAGWLSALCLALAYIHVFNSQYVTTDVPSAFFVAVCLLASIYGMRTGGLRWFAAAGVAAGLAAGAKYNAGLCAVTPVVAALLLKGRDVPSRLKLILVAGLCALGTFLLVVPWVVLDPIAVLEGLKFDIEHYRTGHVGAEGSGNWKWYLLGLWGNWMGQVLMIASAAGVVFLALRRPRQFALLSVHPVIYYALLAAQTVRFARNLMPLVPWLSLLAGYGLYSVVSWISSRSSTRWLPALATAALLALMFMRPVKAIIEYNWLLNQTDTRTLASLWIADHIPSGDRYPRQRAFYENLFGRQLLIAEFKGTDGGHQLYPGPDIRVYELINLP